MDVSLLKVIILEKDVFTVTVPIETFSKSVGDALLQLTSTVAFELEETTICPVTSANVISAKLLRSVVLRVTTVLVPLLVRVADPVL